MAIRKPNWHLWANIVDVTVHQAVALSCNVEPDSIPTQEPYMLSEDIEVLRKYEHRMVIAANHLHRTLAVERADDSGNEYVRLSAFGTWSDSVHFDIPPEFPGTSKTSISPAQDTHENYPTELRAACEAFEAVYRDPSATKRRSPKAALMAWLKENRPELTENARKRIAIVANWLPTGGAPKTPVN